MTNVRIGIAALAILLQANTALACWAAEQDRRFVVAFSNDEAQYAIAKIILKRHPEGAINGAAFWCIHELRTNALVKCKIVGEYGYGAKQGTTVAFHRDFFIDKIEQVRAEFLAKNRKFKAAYTDRPQAVATQSSHNHAVPEPTTRGLAVWRDVSRDNAGSVTQKPVFYVWRPGDKGVEVAHRDQGERESKIDQTSHGSEEVRFYRPPSGKTLVAIFSHRIGSVMHVNTRDVVLPFATKRFVPFTVTIVNGGAPAYLEINKRFKRWKIPVTTAKLPGVQRPTIKARPEFLPLAESLVDSSYRFLTDQKWTIVSSRGAKDCLRIELPSEP